MKFRMNAHGGKLFRITLIAIIALIFPAPTGLSALELDTTLAGIPQEADGEAYRLDRNHKGIMLLPDTPMAREIEVRNAALEPDVFTEALYLIPYPDGENSVDLDFYNLTRKVSAISEVVYMSHRKKAIVSLFDNVYAVEDKKRKRRIDNPLVSSIPASDTVLMHMKEAKPGSAHYQVDYLSDAENLILEIINENYQSIHQRNLASTGDLSLEIDQRCPQKARYQGLRHLCTGIYFGQV